MIKKRLSALFVPIIGISCLLCSCNQSYHGVYYLTAEKYFDFAETKDLIFYLDDDSFYFPTDEVDTIYYDDLSEIDASTTSIHDIVVISNLDNNYSFSDSDASGITTMFEQGAMVIFVNFQRSVAEKYESAFISMNIEKSVYESLGDIAILYRCNGEMIKLLAEQNLEYPIQDHTDYLWNDIFYYVMDMYEELGYIR